MAGPSKDIPASDLFLKLTEAPRPTEVVDYPRMDLSTGKPVGQVRIQVLNHIEHDNARKLAHQKMKEQGFDKDDLQGTTIQEVMGDAVARELLAMACLTVENYNDDPNDTPIYGRMFRDASDLSKLRSDEIAVLFGKYLYTQAKYGPYEGNISSKEDVDAWVKRLVDGGSPFLVLHLPLPQLADLTFLLAERVSTLSESLASLSRESQPSSESNQETSSTVTS